MLVTEIRSEFNQARKDRNLVAKSAYESVIAKMLIAEKDGKHEVPLKDDVVVDLLKKEIKELKETQSFYSEENEQYVLLESKINLLTGYLPEELPEERVIDIIREFVSKGETNKGKLIGLTIKEVGANFDKSKVAGLVNKVLS